MQRLSSPTERFVNKYLVPNIALIVFNAFILMALHDKNAPLWIFPIFFGLFFLVIYLIKKQTLDLVDIAYDDGNALIFKKSGKTVKVMLANIKNISFQPYTQNIEVTLNIQTDFGSKISFALSEPRFQLKPFAKKVYIDCLIERIDNARSNKD